MIWDDSVKFIAFSLSSIKKRIRGKADLDSVKRWCKDPLVRLRPGSGTISAKVLSISSSVST